MRPKWDVATTSHTGWDATLCRLSLVRAFKSWEGRENLFTLKSNHPVPKSLKLVRGYLYIRNIEKCWNHAQSSPTHCIKIVRIRSYSGPYFLAFGLNTERYSVSLCIQSKCDKIRTRITPNTDTFYVVTIAAISTFLSRKTCKFTKIARLYPLNLAILKIHLSCTLSFTPSYLNT